MYSQLKIFLLSFLLPGLVLAQNSRAPKGGDMAGNGGGIVVCGEKVAGGPEGQPEPGVYAIDYIQAGGPNFPFENPTSLKESFQRIEELLGGVKEMQSAFNEFRRLIYNTDASKGIRLWKRTNKELERLHDDESYRKLDVNCKDRDGLGIYQLVIRNVIGSLIIYETNSSFFQKIEAAPLQASLMYVHEWLWDYVDRAYTSRQLNELLHKQGATQAEVTAMIRGLQLKLNVNLNVQPQNTAPEVNSISLVPVTFEDRMEVSLLKFFTKDKDVVYTLAYVKNRLAESNRGSTHKTTDTSSQKAADLLKTEHAWLQKYATNMELRWFERFKREEAEAKRPLPAGFKFEDTEFIRRRVASPLLEEYETSLTRLLERLRQHAWVVENELHSPY